jgi:hypothetical protein
LRKRPKIYGGEKIAFSTNFAGESVSPSARN